MKTLIIYDDLGYILSQSQGISREPIGIPFIWIEIPTGKQTKGIGSIGVDVSVTPNVAILEDIPLTETEILQAKQETSDQAITEISMVIGGMF